jgi:DNA repair protein RadC
MKSDRIKNWPKEERPRERLLTEGADKLTEAELLAIILRVGQGTFKKGVRGQNASDFSRTLLTEFGGLAGLDRAHVQDLLKVPGLGPAKVAQIKAAFKLGKIVCAGKSAAVSFESSQAIADYFRLRFIGKQRLARKARAPLLFSRIKWQFSPAYQSFRLDISSSAASGA